MEIPEKPQYEQIAPIATNGLTLQSYEAGVQEYIIGTSLEVSEGVKVWIDAALGLLSPGARIIEIGSAFGRDAEYIERFGFEVERTDATQGFVDLLQKEGKLACKFNVLTDCFTSKYNLIFANAVFLHFTPQELQAVLEKIYAALGGAKVLAFSVKKGRGEEWTTAKIGHPRYFCYWTADNLESMLKQVGFQFIRVLEDGIFLQVIAQVEN